MLMTNFISCRQNENTTNSARAALDSLKPEQAFELLKDEAYVSQTAEALLIRGTAAFQLKKFEEALSDFDAAARLSPEDYKPFFNRSLVFQELGKVNDAMIDLNRAIKLNPSKKDLYLNRGNLFYLKNEVSDALENFQKVLELDTMNKQALYNVAYIHGSSGNNAQAKIHYEKLLEIDPENAKAQFGLGLALVNLNERVKGCEYLAKSYEAGYQSAIKVIQLYCTSNSANP